MACREIISVSFEIRTTHTNALCWPHRSEMWLEISCRDNRRKVAEWVIMHGDYNLWRMAIRHSQRGRSSMKNAAWPLRGEPSSNHALPTAAMYSVTVSQQVMWLLPCTLHLILQIRYDNWESKGFLYNIQQHKYRVAHEMSYHWLCT